MVIALLYSINITIWWPFWMMSFYTGNDDLRNWHPPRWWSRIPNEYIWVVSLLVTERCHQTNFSALFVGLAGWLFRFQFLSDSGGSAAGSLLTFSKISFLVIFVVFLLSFCYLCVYCVFLVRSCVKTRAHCGVFVVFSFWVYLRPTLLPVCVRDRIYCIFSLLPSVFISSTFTSTLLLSLSTIPSVSCLKIQKKLQQ